jgi:YidC/Oxa1 family membrane protein insertase
MDKRLFLALALSMLVLLTWSRFVVQPEAPSKPKTVSPQTPTSIASINQPLDEILVPADFEYQNGQTRVIFSEPQAAIKEVIFDNYQTYKFPLKYGLLLGDKDLAFTRQPIENNKVTYLYSDIYKVISKQFIFSQSSNSIELILKIQNISSSPLSLELPLYLGVLNFTPTKKSIHYQDVAVADNEKVSYPNIKKDGAFNQLKFIGLRDRYFCAIIEPEGANFIGFIRKSSPMESDIGIMTPKIQLSPGSVWEQKFHLYIGPQDLKIIKAIDPDWQAVIYYGRFDIIAQILLKLLEFVFSLVHNWGWAIIIISIAIYILVYPLTLQQMKSMKEMQKIQPQVEELRKLYKDNAQRLNKEIMELYRQHKVNPFGGCLPMLLQIPVFFALYQVLSRSIALKGADFLWIKDLSEPDRLFKFPVELPFVGQYLNLLPILMAIGMFIQQKSSTSNLGGSAAEQQKMMVIIFPIMFGVIFYNMPAGLVLYWFINSSLMLIYQLKVAKSR